MLTVGFLLERCNMRIEHEAKYDFDDVMIRPKRSSLESRSDVLLKRVLRMPHAGFRMLTGVPIFAANMDTVGTVNAAHALAELDCFTAVHKYITKEDYMELASKSETRQHAFIPVDIKESAEMTSEKLGWAGQSKEDCLLYVDVANGYQEVFIKAISNIRRSFPEAIIMAGNVVTADMTEALIIAGADIVKVGIGPGAQCETRKVTGVGYPQLSAIIECADAAHGLKGFICADGGCRTSGDVAKAFAAGADFVMLGTMLAAHKENVAPEYLKILEDKITRGVESESMLPMLHDVERYADYTLDTACEYFKVPTYGMSSAEAMNKYHGGVAEYRSSEGKLSWLEYRGTIKNTVNQILGGLRSTCTYVGADSLKQLSKRTTFVVTK